MKRDRLSQKSQPKYDQDREAEEAALATVQRDLQQQKHAFRATGTFNFDPDRHVHAV